MLDEIKEYIESGYDKQKVPILFQRYSNTKEQVLPAEDFEPDVLDRYFRESTNVTDKRAVPAAKRSANYWKTEASMSNEDKILIAKVLLIHKFVADIPHFLENVIGSPGAIKTSYLKQQKRLVDPGITEVFTSLITSKDIEQRFAQNYLVVLDNVREIKPWLSDLISAVVTGSGAEKRELYSNEGIVNSILKSCISVGSVNRVFTASDAVTRMAVQGFLEVDETKQGNYISESDAEEQFESIRPKILGCIFSLLSKAIEIRKKIINKYSLGRMADALIWGESISQAMGNPENRFLNTFETLKSIQLTHVVKDDLLTAIYEKLYYEIFRDLDNKTKYNDERYAGCKVFDYKSLQNMLNSIAESEGYKITGKGNPWPKDSRQLTERTREIASQLRKTSGIIVEIRSRKKYVEFIIGHIEGVENYLEIMDEKEASEEQEVEDSDNDQGDAKETYRIVVDACALIVREKNGQAIKGENLLQEVSQENSSARIYIGNKFTLETNWKLKKVFMTLQQQPGIELVCKKPYMFRWNEDLVLPSEESEALSGKKSSYENLTSSIGQVNQVDHKETIIYATSASVDQKDPVAMFSGSLFFSDTPTILYMFGCCTMSTIAGG